MKSLVLGSVMALLLAVGPVAAKIPYFPHPRPIITIGSPVADSPSSAAPRIAAAALGIVAVMLLAGVPIRRRMQRRTTVAR